MPLPSYHRDFFAVTLGLVLFSATFITACPGGDGTRLITVGLLGLTLIVAFLAADLGRRRVAVAAGRLNQRKDLPRAHVARGA